VIFRTDYDESNYKKAVLMSS